MASLMRHFLFYIFHILCCVSLDLKPGGKDSVYLVHNDIFSAWIIETAQWLFADGVKG